MTQVLPNVNLQQVGKRGGGRGTASPRPAERGAGDTPDIQGPGPPLLQASSSGQLVFIVRFNGNTTYFWKLPWTSPTPDRRALCSHQAAPCTVTLTCK